MRNDFRKMITTLISMLYKTEYLFMFINIYFLCNIHFVQVVLK